MYFGVEYENNYNKIAYIHSRQRLYHFDVYYGGKLHFFTPSNPLDTVKFVAFKDRLNEKDS